MQSILRYAARVRRRRARGKESIAIIGAGSLASFLTPALAKAGYEVREIIARAGRSGSFARARGLGRKVGARALTIKTAELDAEVLWLCAPDAEIGGVAAELAARESLGARFAFHSSGALLSGELNALRKAGIATASVHPLMTFVNGGRPSLQAVPFAIEGDASATKLARAIVGDLGGESFLVSARRKVAYHTWATMTSPLLLAYLVTLEDAAREAGLRREDARRMSLPIIRQTLENYRFLGPAGSFSGPFVRGDVNTVAKHLAELKKQPGVSDVYIALAREALRRLPAKNRKELKSLLG